MNLLLFLAYGCALAQTPDVGEIMSRVARSQANSLEARKDWVYSQKQTLRMIRGSGKLAREERREYLIAPQSRGIHKQLTAFTGKYNDKNRDVAYDKPKFQYKGTDIDGQLLDEMSNDMTNDGKSRDGISHDLFPLTQQQQQHYDFTLKATENYRGRQVYRVSFRPKPRQHIEDGMPWKGEALIDTGEYQPVFIQTTLAWKMPMAVKILLGTDIRGLGFSVSYQKFADGVWFPVSYGGEFDVRAVFFYKRKISVSMVNGDFRRADVSSNIAYAMDDK